MATTQQSEPPITTLTCHCKAIRLTFPPLRQKALECLCSICRRYGALWAYYKPEEVHVHGDAADGYVWGDKTLSFNRCKKCGCMTHYSVVGETRPRVAVNCRMLEKDDFKRLESEESDGDGD